MLLHRCVPFIDKKYRTIADRHHRAMAGLSMGGGQTQQTVMKYPEIFVDYEIVKGKMDDVFLAATGKNLKGGDEK